MSYSQQKHIINKLQVDVETQNPRTAFDLKDHLDTFLKQEIFPYLESYFATLEDDLQDQIIQIPYLEVNVETSAVLNYKELKEDVKRALVTNIQKVTKQAHPQNEEVKLLTTTQSTEHEFIHFLEKGNLPWWSRSEHAFDLSAAEFETMITAPSFALRIRKKLMKAVVKKRIIQQLSDAQLKRVWEILAPENHGISLSSNTVHLFASVATEMRQILWNCLIDFALQNDVEILISRLLFSLTEEIEIDEVQKTEQLENKVNNKVNESTSKLVLALLQAIPKSPRSTKAIRILERSEQIQKESAIQKNKAKSGENTSDTTQSQLDLLQEKAADELKSTDSISTEELTATGNKNPLQDDSITTAENQNSERESLARKEEVSETIDATSDSIKNLKEVSSSQNISEKNPLDKVSSSDGKDQEVLNPSTKKTVNPSETVSGVENVNEVIQFSSEEIKTEQKTTAESKEDEQTSSELETFSSNQNKSSDALQNSENTSKAKENKATESKPASEVSQDKPIHERTSEATSFDADNTQRINGEHESHEILENRKERINPTNKGVDSEAQETLKTASNLKEPKETKSDSPSIQEESKQHQNSSENEQDIFKENSSELPQKTFDILAKKPLEKAEGNTQHSEHQEALQSQSNTRSEEANVTQEQVKDALSELVDDQDQKLFKELHRRQLKPTVKMKETGDFQISNAGLIMLHPYFTPFFENCGLLNEDKTLNNPDMAVHLLHYLATKQEQQFESNMLFEKILCGVHSETAIQRNIVLTEEMKSNAEDLLTSVLENWGVLKNASPDLLRGEFLMRFGRINFKETNPKLTVERKVHDVLLDKLPWGIGICRLPWLDYLLFTDW